MKNKRSIGQLHLALAVLLAAAVLLGAADYLIDDTLTLRYGEALPAMGGFPVRAEESAAAAWTGRVSVYNFRFLKPLDREALRGIAGHHRAILTVEDGSLAGGLFGAVSEFLAEAGLSIPVHGIGIPDHFIAQARQAEQYAACGLDVAGIQKSLQKVFENRK